MVYEAFVAPLMLTPPFFHWYVGAGEPLAAAVKVTELPAVTVWLDGCVVNAGAALTVSVAVLLVAELTEFVATTVYEPASPVTVLAMV